MVPNENPNKPKDSARLTHYSLHITQIQIKVKFTYNRTRRPRGEVDVYLSSFFNFGTRWGGWSTPRPSRFTPGHDPEPIV
jgi:hypothetical protein